MLLLLGIVSLNAASDEERPVRKVLLIHSFGRDFAPFDAVASHFRTELARQSPQLIEFVDASLEMSRFDGSEKDAPLLAFLSAIFEKAPPDLLVPVGAPAAHFCLRNRPELFPSTPILGVGMDKRRMGSLAGDPDIVMAALDVDLVALMENILQVRPRTRRVYVTMGVAPLEQYWLSELKKAWAPFARRVETHYLDHLSLEQMKPVLASLPDDAAILHGIVNRDAAGVPHESEKALTELVAVASAPSFGYNSKQLGLGIIGGRLLFPHEPAERAVAAALRLLAGEKPAAIQVEPSPFAEPVYDWRQLQRWRIPETALPAGSAVLFREPSLWQAHRGLILGSVSIAVLQSALIIMLLAARRRARESDAFLSLAAECLGLGVWQRDLATNEIVASDRWRDLFGLHGRRRMHFSDVLDQIPAAEREAVAEAVDSGSRQDGSYLVEHHVQMPDGSLRWIVSMGRAEHPNGSNNGRNRGISMDITERKRIEAELGLQRDQFAHLSRVASLGELSGSLAHELNQPLGAILSNAQAAQRLLARPQLDRKELREILDDIIAADRRAGEVIRRLRAFLQRGETLHEPVNLPVCLQEVLRLIRSDLIERGVMVQTKFAGNLPPVIGDQVQLQQVFLNLLINACDAMAALPRDERVILVTADERDGEAVISIQDHGVGLPEDVEQLFKPFHTTKAGGIGIGLSICRTIAQAHHGRLWAAPNTDAPGAAFHLSLPVLKTSPTHSSHEPASDPGTRR